MLIAKKQEDFVECQSESMFEDEIRQREEITMQINALKEMKTMAESYGFDISKPAKDAREACQWLYFGYLAAIKTQNGAAMSVGRVSTFLDIYIQRDLDNGTLTEEEAQELIDHMVMKFRMVKFARIPSTTNYSQVTRFGLHLMSAGKVVTADQWLQRTTSVSFTHWKTWVLHLNQT